MEKNQDISFAIRMKENLPEVDRIRDIMLDAFQEVLTSLGDQEAASLVNAFGDDRLKTVDPSKFAQVQSICFQVQNLVENAISLKVTKKVNTESVGESGFWLNYLHRLRMQGCSTQTIANRVESSFIEVVFTKHPTEAKRWIILHLHRQLSSLILKLSSGEEVDEEIHEHLELLWRSGELFTNKPTVEQERRNLDYYFQEVFPKARRALDQNFRTAWAQVFKDTPAPLTPFLRIATWVGGDRDGHPLVTSEVTGETLNDLRKLSIHELLKFVETLKAEIRFHRQSQPTPQLLTEWLEHKGFNSDTDEPWSLAFDIIEKSLRNTLHQEAQPYYANKDALVQDLKALEGALESIHAGRLIHRYLTPIYNQLSFYGFHTARLDIRQNSQTYQDALVEILQYAEIPDAENFPTWSEDEKLDFIQKELSNNRPFLLPQVQLSEKTQEVLNTFRTVKKHLDTFGPEGIGDFIVSMTRSASDLMVLYLFCKEVGLLQQKGTTTVSQIHIVPLFETMADLEASVSIMERYIAIPIVKDTLAHLSSPSSLSSSPAPLRLLPQTIMLGYSDSNKDCGIWASQWTVYNTQKRLIELSEKTGIPFRFFHGRGGTVGRGSGPMHRFIEALPQSGLEHGFRITEQGEVIAQKYNSVENAINNFEQLAAGVSCANLLNTHEPIIERATPAMMLVRDSSLAAYRTLIEAQGFLKFYRQATPIDVIELSKIGSRPSRRTGTATLDDLRAIPWVFSWNQSRFYLPGWFGIGSGLKALQQQKPEDFEYLRSIWKEWPFLRYLLYNAESTVASCSIDIIERYAGLVESESIRHCFLTAILQELELSKHMLTEVFSRPFDQGRPRLHYTLKARDQRLHELHLQQIELLTQWRGSNAISDANSPLLPQLLQNINAIASGLKTTG